MAPAYSVVDVVDLVDRVDDERKERCSQCRPAAVSNNVVVQAPAPLKKGGSQHQSTPAPASSKPAGRDFECNSVYYSSLGRVVTADFFILING
jgi:hypothetical protein